MRKNFEKFIKSGWGLEIWRGDKPIFRSKKSGVKGLFDFIKNHENVSRRDEKRSRNFVIFDKIVGRGAALLAIYLGAKEVYGAVGSRLAVKALRRYKIRFYFKKTVANILNKDKTDLCPMEKLSFDKSPEDFYHCLRR